MKDFIMIVREKDMPAYKEKNKNAWYVSFYYLDWSGERKRCHKRGFSTKREAIEYENTFKEKNNKSLSMNFEDFIDIYFADKEHELKERTINSKKYMINRHIIPFFKGRKINEIQASDIIKWQNKIIKQGYSECYNRMLNNQINAIFNHASIIYDLKSNPCKKTKRIGKSSKKGVEFWTKSEYDEFISKVNDEKYIVLYNLLYFSGMRIGEALALTSNDINFETNQIHITKTYCKIGDKELITTPKTEESNRIIDMPGFVISQIKEYISKLYEFSANERIWEMTIRAVEIKMQRIIKKYNLKKIKLHSLRHSHVAYLISLGVQPIVIKERVGHTDIRMTLNTYGHLYPNEHRKVADMLDKNEKNKV